MFVGSWRRGKKVYPFPQISPSLALWLERGAAEVESAVWNVEVAVWLTAGSVMMQRPPPPKVCMWPSWCILQPCQGQDAEAGAAFSPTQPC